MSISYKATPVLNVSKLFSISAKHDEVFQTLGYNTKGVGGNLYRYDATSSATPDGGFTLPGVGGTLSFSGTTFNGVAGTGRFIAVDQSVADVTEFGAIGSAASDTSAFLRAALASLNVRLSTGTYILNSSVPLRAGHNIIGNGRLNTQIQLNADIAAFTSNGAYQWFIKGFKVVAASGVPVSSGKAIEFTGGNSYTCKMHDVDVHSIRNAVLISAGADVTVFDIENFTVQNCGSHCIEVVSGAGHVNKLSIRSSNFEQTQAGHIHFDTSVVAHTFTANETVFEACAGQYSINLGSSPYATVISGCHFEANGSGGTADGADIRWHGGSGSVEVRSCNFGVPHASNSGFINIRSTGVSDVSARLIGNTVSSATAGNASQYSGFYNVPRTLLYLNGNKYTGSSALTKSFVGGYATLNRANTVGDEVFGTWHKTQHGWVGAVRTTDATPTTISMFDYAANYPITSGTYFFRASVVGHAEDGLDSFVYHRTIAVRVVASPLSITDLGVVTADGTVETDAGANAAFTVSTTSLGTIELVVTGLASRDIRWTSMIELVFAGNN